MDGKILVTGGAGYVGSHVVVALADAGYVPIILDNFATSSRNAVPRLSALTGLALDVVEADVRDSQALRRTFHDFPIVAVVHCAALKGVGDGEARPLAFWDVNVGGTVALAEVMGEAGVARFVYSSSATVYGQPDRLPVAEEAPLRPQNVYGRTKRAAEDFLRDLTRANANWRIAILRYFNPAGAHPSARIGEHFGERRENLVPHLCGIAAGAEGELAIYGSDWPTPDGTGIRDYLHVVDLAEAHVAAVRFLASAPGATTFNLGAGRGYSVLEVVTAFERACGRRIARTFVPRRAGDVACYYADPSRAQALLAWHARRGLDAICEDAWRWQQSGGY
ncbi:MAG TPA: UDP-glucose 4-epimerase GalE [Casimicrobiaceae bacterium]|jgi:UDP-glucose 4-epimerase|nr:UDP-glucose 4-epimerase GalE [Casimicrobiaceae bacterium]